MSKPSQPTNQTTAAKEADAAEALRQSTALTQALAARVAELEAKLAPPPDPNAPIPLPDFDTAPPKKGLARIRIKSVQGKAVVPKIKLVDDTTDHDSENYRCHGFLHAREVVDVPVALLKQLKSRQGASLLDDKEIIEEVPSKPSTRPLFYESEADCRVADPRNHGADRAKVKADLERIAASARKKPTYREEKVDA